MSAFTKLRKFLARRTNGPDIDPESAYDLWSDHYDNQPENLILALDREVFNILIEDLDFRSTTIADVGCGTGRHWHQILDCGPARLVGFDVSSGMLAKLQEKIPDAETHRISDFRLPTLYDQSCDFVISTLAVAHMEDFENVFKEWCRVLKTNGRLIITDYHPVALQHGANRTFMHKNRSFSIKNHIYSIERLKMMAGQFAMESVRFIERKIDESVVGFYEKKNAMDVYAKFKGSPIIYGIMFKKISC
ncbi:MAG: class I SAM-dependent methyltransferase [Chitinophagales bacterium]